MAQVGNRVLICNQDWEREVFKGNFKPEYGTVVKQYQSNDYSYHGIPLYDDVTVVKGDDGKQYTDNRDSFLHKVFFTESEFAYALKYRIQSKENEIATANRQIDVLKSQLKQFEPQREIVEHGTHGSCGWDIDKEGTLTIRPLNGNHGVLKNQSELGGRTPWREFNSQIFKVVVEQGVHANYDASNLFAHMHNCKEMDLRGLDTSHTQNMENMFYNCSSLEKVHGTLNMQKVNNRFNMLSFSSKLKNKDFIKGKEVCSGEKTWQPPKPKKEQRSRELSEMFR